MAGELDVDSILQRDKFRGKGDMIERDGCICHNKILVVQLQYIGTTAKHGIWCRKEDEIEACSVYKMLFISTMEDELHYLVVVFCGQEETQQKRLELTVAANALDLGS
ncbi:hypothetical protein ACJMK2_015624 [Sinanodonta woodiana]|uniref:Uncharacterized protein n=1 Tax=Sinanodonta woodiana TaxID=1069815 RepID=A0ABD3UQY7_SINWO